MAGRKSGGYSKPEPIRDKSGRVLRIGFYYDNEAREYKNVEGAKFKDLHLIAADAMDWDADGDLDLIQGTNSGRILLRLNEGSAAKAAFALESVQLKCTDGSELSVPGGKAMPFLADWDGDGLVDILSGSGDGGAVWFRNTGERGKPSFAKAQTLVAASKGEEDSANPLWPGNRTQAAAVDFDGDGDLDLLLGDRYTESVEGNPRGKRHGWVWLFRREG